MFTTILEPAPTTIYTDVVIQAPSPSDGKPITDSDYLLYQRGHHNYANLNCLRFENLRQPIQKPCP